MISQCKHLTLFDMSQSQITIKTLAHIDVIRPSLNFGVEDCPNVTDEMAAEWSKKIHRLKYFTNSNFSQPAGSIHVRIVL